MTIQHALRSLQRRPRFAITMILTLVLGIGSMGSMFAIVYGVLLAPLPYGEPQRLVSITLQGLIRRWRFALSNCLSLNGAGAVFANSLQTHS